MLFKYSATNNSLNQEKIKMGQKNSTIWLQESLNIGLTTMLPVSMEICISHSSLTWALPDLILCHGAIKILGEGKLFQ
jgi:hypothetical protein